MRVALLSALTVFLISSVARAEPPCSAASAKVALDYQMGFGQIPHTLTITNPDSQSAVLAFTVS
jgi:hypothetical protein